MITCRECGAPLQDGTCEGCASEQAMKYVAYYYPSKDAPGRKDEFRAEDDYTARLYAGMVSRNTGRALRQLIRVNNDRTWSCLSIGGKS